MPCVGTPLPSPNPPAADPLESKQQNRCLDSAVSGNGAIVLAICDSTNAAHSTTLNLEPGFDAERVNQQQSFYIELKNLVHQPPQHNGIPSDATASGTSSSNDLTIFKDSDSFLALSNPVECWHFDLRWLFVCLSTNFKFRKMPSRVQYLLLITLSLYFNRSPPDGSSTKHLDMEMLCQGGWNAVAYWGEILLYGDITLSTSKQIAIVCGVEFLD